MMKQLKINEFFSQSPLLATIITGINLQKKINAELSKYDLNLFSSMIVVAIFFEREKTIRPSYLYDLLPLTKGNVSHMTSALEEKKLIQRYMSANDLRGFDFKLTQKGEKLALNLIRFFNDKEDQIDRKISRNEMKKIFDLFILLENDQ